MLFLDTSSLSYDFLCLGALLESMRAFSFVFRGCFWIDGASHLSNVTLCLRAVLTLKGALNVVLSDTFGGWVKTQLEFVIFFEILRFLVFCVFFAVHV